MFLETITRSDIPNPSEMIDILYESESFINDITMDVMVKEHSALMLGESLDILSEDFDDWKKKVKETLTNAYQKFMLFVDNVIATWTTLQAEIQVKFLDRAKLKHALESFKDIKFKSGRADKLEVKGKPNTMKKVLDLMEKAASQTDEIVKGALVKIKGIDLSDGIAVQSIKDGSTGSFSRNQLNHIEVSLGKNKNSLGTNSFDNYFGQYVNKKFYSNAAVQELIAQIKLEDETEEKFVITIDHIKDASKFLDGRKKFIIRLKAYKNHIKAIQDEALRKLTKDDGENKRRIVSYTTLTQRLVTKYITLVNKCTNTAVKICKKANNAVQGFNPSKKKK